MVLLHPLSDLKTAALSPDFLYQLQFLRLLPSLLALFPCWASAWRLPEAAPVDSAEAAVASCWLLRTFRLREARVALLPASDWQHGDLGRALGATAVSAFLGSVNSDYMVRTVV